MTHPLTAPRPLETPDSVKRHRVHHRSDAASTRLTTASSGLRAQCDTLGADTTLARRR
jgi:hypothetical protein